MKKIFIILSVSFIISFIFFIYKKSTFSKNNFSIGILQTASHPALNAVTNNFIQTIKKELGQNTNIILKNADGSVTQAYTIAQQFSFDDSIDSFFTVGTLATQALHQQEKKRPIVIAAVSDPAALGLVYPKSNICGITDMSPIKEIFETITEIFKNKTIGILYTIGETNSQNILKKIDTEAEKNNYQIKKFGFMNETEVATVTDLACRRADVLFLPTDNVVASSIELISDIAKKQHIPIVMSDNSLLSHGGIFSQGIDYNDQGVESAHIMLLILKKNKKPSELSILSPKKMNLYINKKMIDFYQLTIGINKLYQYIN